jgi:hypothetical protein
MRIITKCLKMPFFDDGMSRTPLNGIYISNVAKSQLRILNVEVKSG